MTRNLLFTGDLKTGEEYAEMLYKNRITNREENMIDITMTCISNFLIIFQTLVDEISLVVGWIR
jgi:hypothetical protein